MITFLLGAVLIIAGLWIVYFNISKSKIDDAKAAQFLSIASLFMVSGIMLVIGSIKPEKLLMKALGLVVFLIGHFLSFGFPDMGDYHPSDFDYLPFLFGLVIMSIGIYILFFY